MNAAKTLLIGQSGGATAVINATLAGAIQGARATGSFSRIVGMRFGMEGLLDGDLVDLTGVPDALLDQIRRTPSAALGSSRRKLKDDELDHVLDMTDSLGMRGMVLIGGNDSADASHRLARRASERRMDFAAIAAPKTVDNDLKETDHCPGYGSAARFLANYVRDATYDTLAAPDLYPVKFIDVAGRDAGWIAASCALAFSEDERDLLPILYLPERPPRSRDEMVDEVLAQVADRGWAVAVVPETLRDAGGRHLGGDTPDYVDPFGHPYYTPPALRLAQVISERTGLRARSERPGSAARMSISLVSNVDQDEAYRAGWAAAELAAAGETDRMVTLERVSDAPYLARTGSAPLALVANLVRPLPDAFIGAGGRSITDQFRAYALPLLGPDPFPAYARFAFARQTSGVKSRSLLADWRATGHSDDDTRSTRGDPASEK